MKKSLLVLCLALFSIATFAQNKFDIQIKDKSAKLNKSTTVEQFDSLFQEFATLVRSNDANKWKAYYFAGLAQYKKAELLLKAGNTAAASDANAIAFKYISGGVPADNLDGKKLLQMIAEQKKQL